MHVLISGAGPAGLTLALLLGRQGVRCTVIEKAPNIRPEGYLVWLGPNGFEVCERLGLIPALRAREVDIERIDYYNSRGKRVSGYSYRGFSEANAGRMVRVMRYVLQQCLYEVMPDSVSIEFGTEITALDDDGSRVTAQLSSGTAIDVDLVIAADGAHSGVRRLVMGPEERFARPIGIRVAAYRIGSRLGLPERQVKSTIGVGRTTGVYPADDGKAVAFFLYRHAFIRPGASRIDEVRGIFADWPGLVADALAAIEQPDALYSDDVVQIELPRWSTGRVVTIGDAAHCMSFLSGQGTSLAMAGAWMLAREIMARPLGEALQAFEAALRPTVMAIQARARAKAWLFLPRNRIEYGVRNAIVRASFTRLLAKRTSRSYSEPLVLGD